MKVHAELIPETCGKEKRIFKCSATCLTTNWLSNEWIKELN